MARPLKKIDPRIVENLAGIGCSNIEIARVLGVCDDTITNRFSENLKKGAERLKMKLRRAQIRYALKGNTILLIFLGKQYLGQSDRPAEAKEKIEAPELKIIRPQIAEPSAG